MDGRPATFVVRGATALVPVLVVMGRPSRMPVVFSGVHLGGLRGPDGQHRADTIPERRAQA